MPAKWKPRTSWREKLERPQEARIVEMSPEEAKHWGGRTVVIARPLDVDELVRTVPKGKLVTMAQIRARLAKKYGAETACPLTTGIFVRIVAEVAEEDRTLGKKRIAPYWRVIKSDGGMNEKYPCGAKGQAGILHAEGHKLSAATGKRAPRILDFKDKLVNW